MSRRQLRTAEAIEAFIASRRARGCSAAYEAWLRYHLGQLAKAFLELPTAPEQLELVLSRRDVSPETRLGTWTVFRRFYSWAARRLQVPNAAADVERPLVRPKVLRTLSDDQVDRLLWLHRRRPREHALLSLLLDTGARIGEVANLRWSDVGPDRVRLAGKGGEHYAPISADTSRALMRLGAGAGAPLWQGKRGPLSLIGLKGVVRTALLRVGVRGGPHMLRHTFGTLYVRRGGDVFSLQRIMGHTKLDTTRRYVDQLPPDVLQQHARFSPVAVRSVGGVQGDLFRGAGADAAGGS